MRRLKSGHIALLAGLGWLAACGPSRALWEPTPELLARQAPDSFVVEVETSEGAFHITMHRAWSPLGVDRVYQLMSNDFYSGARFYRVLPGFVAQWGFSGTPALDSVWQEHTLADEPTVSTNARGTVSFARAGAETRSYTLFINLVDNARLDDAAAGGVVGYPPIGRIINGLEVADGFYAAYGESPRQDSIAALGNEYLRGSFPQLDSIVATRVILEWP
jgi:cyclophilin family peptidyl-prolyl cis-trans isomerase